MMHRIRLVRITMEVVILEEDAVSQIMCVLELAVSLLIDFWEGRGS